MLRKDKIGGCCFPKLDLRQLDVEMLFGDGKTVVENFAGRTLMWSAWVVLSQVLKSQTPCR
jgi:hypothetical protein